MQWCRTQLYLKILLKSHKSDFFWVKKSIYKDLYLSVSCEERIFWYFWPGFLCHFVQLFRGSVVWNIFFDYIDDSFFIEIVYFYHEIPKTSSYWFGWSVNDDWQSQSLSHVVVLNPGPLDWLSIALTTRPLLHVLQSLLLVPDILIWVSLIKPSRKRSDVYFHVMQLFVCVFFQAGWLKLIHNIVEGGIICGACV